MSNIIQLFSGASHFGTVINYEEDQFIVYFEAAEFIERVESMINMNLEDALLNWFVFSVDKENILLVSETEYSEYELIFYDKGHKSI